jgi:hypothetical protein
VTPDSHNNSPSFRWASAWREATEDTREDYTMALAELNARVLILANPFIGGQPQTLIALPGIHARH